VSQEWAPLLEQAMLVFLLVLGYAGFGSWMDRQRSPVSAQGLPRRAGLLREVGLGLSVGWSIAVICVLPLVVVGGIEIVLALQPSAWGWLLADAAFFALAALAEEIAFRGYGFQRLFIQWDQSARRWALLLSTALSRRCCRGRITPALQFLSCSHWCFPWLTCARGRYG